MDAESVHPPGTLLSQYARIWRILPRSFRMGSLALLGGTIIGAALEVLGLSLLTALIAVITPGGSLGPSSPGFVQSLFPGGASAKATGLVALTGLAFLLKNLFMGGLAWLEATFAFSLQSHLADRALAGTLRLDYEEVTRHPPSQFLNLVTNDLSLVITQFALPTLTLVAEAMLTLGVIAFLLWMEPVITSIVVVMVGGAGWILMHWSRRTMARVGRRRQALEDERMRRTREIFGHLREVYVYRAGEQARQHLVAGMEEIAKVYQTYQMMATGPRFLLEIVLIAVLLSAVIVGLQQNERHALIVSVGVFAASGFRLLIGANRLVMSAQAIRFSRPAVQRMIAAIDPGLAMHARLSGHSDPVEPASESLSLSGVHYRHRDSASELLSGVNLELRRGQIIGIQGGSGGGKTTLLELMAGLRRPIAGQVLFDGHAVRSAGRNSFHGVGYVGQSPAVFSDSVRRNVAYGCPDAQINDGKVWLALEKARLSGLVRSLPGGLDHQLGGSSLNLSGGQAQRLALARALYGDCVFLLLDEPTSALDPATEEEVMATLGELAPECGILLVSHRSKPLESCDLVYELRGGRLAVARAPLLS